MSKFGKRFVSCLLAAMMMLSLFPLSAFASNDGNGANDDTSSEQSTTAVAKIGDKEYGTLQEAVNDAPADGTETTIELLSDTEVAAQITIKEGQNIIVNANNKTLTLPSTNFEGRFFENKGTLTLTGNGIFNATNAGTKGYGTVNNFGTLTVINGTYTNLKDSDTFNFYNRNGGTATFVNPTINGGGGCIATEVNTTTTIQGGNYTDETYPAIENRGNMLITGGIFTNTSCSSCSGKWGYTIRSGYESDTAYLKIQGTDDNSVSVTGVQGGLAVIGGTADIYNGTYQTVPCTTHGGGNAFYAGYFTGESYKTSTNIYGGTFTSCTKTAILVGNGNPAPDSGAGEDSTVMIYGGTFTGGDEKKTAVTVNEEKHAIGAAKIFGGTFSSDPTAYLKDGYGTTQADENWTVTATKPVAKIGDKQYASLEDAINAASSGDTITMLQNAETTDVSISGKSNLTIDGNGYSLHSVNFGGNNNSITIKNVIFTITNQGNVIAINGQNNNNITISGCSFTLTENASAWVAIYVQKLSDGLTIENNTFTLNRPDANDFQCIGFAFTPDMRATDATIKGNTVTANNTTNTAYFVIGGNAASDNQYGLKNLTISNNTLTASNTGELIGARIANSDKLTVNGNIFNCTTGVRLSATDGIASKDITITNNNGSAKTMIELKGAQPIVSGFITDVPADKISFSEGSDKYNIKVAFDANGGNCDVATSVLPLSNGAASMDALPTATRNGYTFDGWFTAADGGEQVKEDHVFSADTTLYAHWTKISSGGGSTVIPTPDPEEPSDSEETVTNPDGSTTTTITKEDGSSSTTTVGTDGKVESEVTISKDAVDNADGAAVALPMPELSVTTDKSAAPTVTVNLPSKNATKVEVPVKDVTPGTVAVLVDADGNETVIKDTVQSDNGITVEVTDGATIKVVDNSKSFNDVADNYWGAGAIDFATSRELFAGTAENTFSPESDMTRAMIWSVLARYEGADIPGGTGDTWYAGPQQWAMENGISDGTMANSSMTREQFAAMLYRYVGSPAVSGTVGNYSDADSISSWAQDAMVWAVQQGLIAGMDEDTLSPQGTATRTQVAAIFQRFIENKMA